MTITLHKRVLWTLKRKLKDLIPYQTKEYFKRVERQIGTQHQELQHLKVRLRHRREDDVRPTLNSRVSVIIPTFNAGPYFEVVLKKIVTQQAIPSPEIIVVDSGSTDQTLKIAKANGATIISIKPKDFSHPFARNTGAEKATGEYLLFMVQDAFLLNEYTIADMVVALTENAPAAGTIRQIPRVDADEFAAWQISLYTEMLSPTGDDMVTALTPQQFKKLPLAAKRAHCTLDDVFAMYPRTLFNKMGGYDVKWTYGEDLAMGKRLVETGNHLVFLASNGVVHSHTRSGEYFMKRYFTDTLFLYQVFGEKGPEPISEISSLNQLFSLLITLGLYLEHYLSKPHDQQWPADRIIADSPSLNGKEKSTLSSVTCLQATHQEMKIGTLITDHSEKQLLPVMKHVLQMITTANEFAHFRLNSTDGREREFMLADKVFAIFASSHLVAYSLHASRKSSKESKELEKIERLFTDTI